MRLKDITIRNFKSIKELSLDIRDFQVLIGPNGSGKTNFVEFFKFLKSLVQEKMAPYNPLAYWWGYENIVHNFDVGSSIQAKFTFEKNECQIVYELTLGLSPIDGKFGLIEEKLELEGYYSFRRVENHVELNLNKDIIKNLDETEFESGFIRPEELDKIKTKYTYKISRATHNLALLSFSQGGQYENSKNYRVGYLNERYENRPIIVLSPKIDDKPFEGLSIFDLQLQIRNFILNISILRHPNLDEMRKPVEITNTVLLDEMGKNMNEILYRWFLQNKDKFNDIVDVIRNVFPEIRIGFELTQDNRVFLVAFQNDMKLKPINISDGLFKMLFVLTALETNPSLLLIDEIDNSLYKESLELLLDTITYKGVPTCITTHSPLVVDQVGLEHLLICSYTKSDGTIFTKPDNIDQLRRKLADLKITWSDAWYSGQLVS